jgi:sulfite exporter TauE/SafE
MITIFTAFLTGLTAGGLSCLAVQGGLLASSLASQVEQNVRQGVKSKSNLSHSLMLFLFAKLVTHTILGFLLGWVGTILQLTPLSRAILQFSIGVFMIGNALRMLNVHPIFRYFAFEPPAFIRRTIRKNSKNGDQWITPLVLGAMTVLIPCGITQSMMTLAVASGDPLSGAALLFAFILGTSPVFFVVAFFTTQLGAKLEKGFTTFVAILLIALGLFSIYTGTNLIVLPLTSITGSTSNNTNFAINPFANTETFQNGATLTINVENSGYRPNHLIAPANQMITLKLVTQNTVSCSRAFVIPALNQQILLSSTGTEVMEIPPQKSGTVMRFSCSMGMYTGDITFK